MNIWESLTGRQDDLKRKNMTKEDLLALNFCEPWLSKVKVF